MQIYNHLINRKNTCAAIGAFDGMHLGHRAVLRQLVEESRKRGREAVAVTWKGGTEGQKVLTNQEEKAWLMEKIGVDVMVFLDIEELEKGSGELETEILRRLGSSLVVSGNTAGPGLQGTDLCRVREVCDEKGRISTDRVRRALILGDMEYTAQLCGYPYIMMGRVVHGKAIGRTVGMPTANLAVPSEKQYPPNGVYASLARVDGHVYRGLTNIGPRPSVDDLPQITVETFIQNFDREIYGEPMVLEIHKHIRDIRKFSGIKEVREQVQRDVVQVKEYFDKR
ncbi:MAG: riboflavin kinase [Lachnospiraceae bacterium]|jgi:riboflavin kinase/FMN adenylyltransferase|nr:riboflavin kinase [Lachnospiraceae bacterium]